LKGTRIMATPSLSRVLSHLLTLAGADSARELSDRQLLEQFAARKDEAAFEALLRRHGRLVWSVCRNVLRHDQDAEDAFQATFLVLARRAASIRKSEALASWLHGVAYRVALKARRSAARRRSHEREAPRSEPSQPIGESAWRDLQAALDEEVQGLPERLRGPFVLCCLEGKGPSYAAAELGWKVSTVHTRVSEARQELLRRLARRGVSLSATLCAVDLFRESAAAALPIGLAKLTVCAALATTVGQTGAISAHAAALAEGSRLHGREALGWGNVSIRSAVRGRSQRPGRARSRSQACSGACQAREDGKRQQENHRRRPCRRSGR
jgi:RNA polymerase sigma factor (sigma-70 family)